MIGKESDVPKPMKIPLPVSLAALVLCFGLAAAAPEALPLPSPHQRTGDVESLVRDLGNESFRIREKATREIWELGEAALPTLKDVVGSGTPEQAHRARDLLRKIQLHITPDTDPSITALVERYLKASPSEKTSLFGKLKDKRAWCQMLKLYASETHEELREKLAGPMTGIAVKAARERLLRGDAEAAREFLEMAPANVGGLLALAEFHRSHGSLEAELERAKELQGRKGAAWRLALERASGNLQAARDAAAAAGQPRTAAAMAALSGDPLPWLLEPMGGADENDDPVSVTYARLAAKRWTGKKIRAVDLEPLIRALSARSARRSGAAMNALFLLGEVNPAESAFVKSEPLAAFQHFESLERIPDAFKALGLNPDQPDYQPWIGKRLSSLGDDEIEDQNEVSAAGEELVALANFLERRGLHQESFDAFAGPLAALEEKDPHLFVDFLEMLAGNSQSQNGAPMLAKRIGIIWAGGDERRWDDLVSAAFGDQELSSTWWDWLQDLEPTASREERFEGMLALYGISTDPSNLRQRWLDRAWKAVDEAPAETRSVLAGRISGLVDQTGDVANSFRAWQQLPEETQQATFWGQRVIHLSVLERWDEAAAVILQQIETFTEAKQEPGAELYAYAAAALRRAGHEDEAIIHDGWADKLFLGSPSLAMRIGNGYAYGSDYQRAGDWWARAAREADPDSNEFTVAVKLHADELIQQGRWKEAAATSEMLARIYATSDFRWTNPLPFMRQRLQADAARALSSLETHRAESIALLEQCHRLFATDGSLADYFFPALRKVGLVKEHDRWFNETWNLMEKVIQKYPNSDNTRNTAAWFASRAQLKLDTAEKYLAAALAANPNQSAYLDTMAEIQFAKGNRDKAVEWSKQAINFAPDDLQFPQLRRQQERFRSAPLPEH